MNTVQPIVSRSIVVAGGSTGTGELVTSLARARGRSVTILDAPETATTRSLRSTLAGAQGVILIPARGTHSVAAQARALIEACSHRPASRPHVVLVTGFSVAHGRAHALNTPERLNDLLTAEQMVRSSSHRYTVVRPTWLTSDPPGRYTVTLTQDPRADGMLARADLARLCLAAIDEPQAWGKTFAAFAEPGPAPARWAPMFTALLTDQSMRL